MTVAVTDPRSISVSERRVPLLNKKKKNEKTMDGDKDLGCCGYDELSTKPATTTPLTFGGSRSRAQVQAKAEPELGDRPRIIATSDPMEQAKGIPTQGVGRGSETMASIPVMGKSVFDGPRGPGNQLHEVSMATQPRFVRPRVKAVLGQEVKDSPSVPRIDAVLARETLPQGLTKMEAEELAASLEGALLNSTQALIEGIECFGVDETILSSVRGLQGGLIRFARNAQDDARLEIGQEDVSIIERVLECGSLYEKAREAETAKGNAFLAGGLIIGTLILIVVSR